jgi:hypothetical protein
MATFGVGLEFVALCATAAGVGVIHTLLGPDHYLPFAAMARAGDWSTTKTIGVTAACGVGHVAGSVAIGSIGLALGAALLDLAALEGIRGAAAAWLLMAFGLGYLAWGLLRASRGHDGSHLHADGRINSHHPTIADLGPRAVSKEAAGDALDQAADPVAVWTPWMLFLVFVFGPCEPLIPLMLVPAAKGSPLAVAGVAATFAVATVATMIVTVLAIRSGIGLVPAPALHRYAHALAGLAVLLCGAAVSFGL